MRWLYDWLHTEPGEDELTLMLEEAAQLIQQDGRKMEFAPRIGTVCTFALQLPLDLQL